MARGPAKTPTSRPSASRDVADFLAEVAKTPARGQAGGRLIFALDATMSRQPTWDAASAIQADMFAETAAIGELLVQLVYFRGFREFEASPWLGEAKGLRRAMTGIGCRAGKTQIGRVLAHALAETKKKRVAALVYVGDAVEEDIDGVCALAGELGLQGVPAFVFHEGRDATTERAFRELARLTRGAYCRFDLGAAKTLRELLKAVAVYAAGGRKALADYGRKAGGAALLIANQMK